MENNLNYILSFYNTHTILQPYRYESIPLSNSVIHDLLTQPYR